MIKTTTHTKLKGDVSQRLLQLGERAGSFCFFQSPVFFELAELVPSYKPMLITAEDENGDLLGSMLAILISENESLKSKLTERIIVFSGPVIASGISSQDSGQAKNEILDSLLDELKKSTDNKVLFTQFRNFYDTTAHKETYTGHGFSFRPRANLIIDCRSGDLVWKGLRDNRKRQLKKMGVNGEKDKRQKIKEGGGAYYCEAGSVEEVGALYDILQNLYRNKVRKPLPPFEYFRYFYEKIHGTEWGKIFVVKYEDEVVGGIVCPITPGKTLYELYICGKDKELKDKGVYPSVLATWAGIEYAIENNIPYFDFMGMGIPGRPYGVREFKIRFGGQLINYGRWTRINNPLLYHIAEFGYNVMAVVKRV